MDLQKVKEALENARDFFMEQGYAPDFFDSILEELAKPVNEDALSSVTKWAEEYFDHDIIVGGIHQSLAELLQQYAEAYHAKRCGECTQKRAPYRPFGIDQLPEAPK